MCDDGPSSMASLRCLYRDADWHCSANQFVRVHRCPTRRHQLGQSFPFLYRPLLHNCNLRYVTVQCGTHKQHFCRHFRVSLEWNAVELVALTKLDKSRDEHGRRGVTLPVACRSAGHSQPLIECTTFGAFSHHLHGQAPLASVQSMVRARVTN